MIGHMFPQALSRPQADVHLAGDAVISDEQSKWGNYSLKSGAIINTGTSVIRYAQSNLFGENEEVGISGDKGHGTVEFWYYKSTFPASYTFLFDMTNVSTEIGILVGADKIYVRARFGGTTYSGTLATLSRPAWHHIAITLRDNVYADLYTDGTLRHTIGNGTDTLVTSGGIDWRLGVGGTGDYFNDFRVSTNVRYTSNFTPPTAAFENDEHTYMLIPFDAAGSYDTTDIKEQHREVWGSTTTICPKTYDITPYNDAAMSASDKKFGNTSLAVNTADLTNADAVMFTANEGITLGTGDFTIEGWFNSSQTNATWRYFWDMRNWSSPNTTPFLLHVSGQIRVYSQGSNSLAYAWTPTNGTWYHIAVVRSSGTTSLYIDGTSVGTPFTDTFDYPETARIVVGGINTLIAANGFQGYIDEFRISDTARYTTNFTPATSPFLLDSNTLLLCHFNALPEGALNDNLG